MNYFFISAESFENHLDCRNIKTTIYFQIVYIILWHVCETNSFELY